MARLKEKEDIMSVLNSLLTECYVDPDELAVPLGLSEDQLRHLESIAEKYPIRIPPYYFDLIGENWQEDPIRRLCLPDPMETCGDGLKDTSGEGLNTVVQGMQHKYDRTALVLTTNQCAMYCRHCFRKRMVGSNADEIASHIGEMVAYVEAHPEIDNVLLSGGDALINDNSRIREYIHAFIDLPNIRYVRLGTRVPVVLPRRITLDQELLDILKEANEKKQVLIVTHFNHPKEITAESRAAVRALLASGCPVRNQTVLLKNVNDDPEVLSNLLNGLVGIGVLPYYIFQCRPAMGVMNQFQVPLLRGQAIVDKARALMSGQAKQFRYCLSHVTGKIEILGCPEGDNNMLFKYHQSKAAVNENRMFFAKLEEDQCWLP